MRVFSIGGISGSSEGRVRRSAAVVEVVLEELLDLDVLQGIVGLLPSRPPPPGATSSAVGLLDRDLLEEGVLHHLLLEDLGQLEGGEGQELDRLLERRGEDEPLGEPGREPQLLLHRQAFSLRLRSVASGLALVQAEGFAEVDAAHLRVRSELERRA